MANLVILFSFRKKNMINLLPISQVTKITETDKVHLAYLTKLRILPQTIRRKINGAIHGCYPESVIPLIKRVEELKSQGLTYSQIKLNFAYQPVTAPKNTNSFAFLIIGLLLGYLLAINNVHPETVRPVSAVSPLDQNNKTMVEPIYLIPVSKQNFDKLGTVNINDLIKN